MREIIRKFFGVGSCLIACPFALNGTAIGHTPSLPADFPNLNGSHWSGKDYDGKNYQITLTQTAGKPTKTTTAGQWIIGGTATFTTNPDQKLKTCKYYLKGPTGHLGHHSEELIPTYTIQFNWSGGLSMDGTFCPGSDQIPMNSVEPFVVDIDFKTLFGNDYKGKQWYGEIVNCAGKDIPFWIEFCKDANATRKALDGTLDSDGSLISPGPKDLGEECYYQGELRLVFIRRNVLVQIPQSSASILMADPAVKKRVEEIARILDAAIHNADPSVSIVGLPMRLRAN